MDQYRKYSSLPSIPFPARVSELGMDEIATWQNRIPYFSLVLHAVYNATFPQLDQSSSMWLFHPFSAHFSELETDGIA